MRVSIGDRLESVVESEVAQSGRGRDQLNVGCRIKKLGAVALKGAVERIEALGVTAVPVQTDVSDEASMLHLADAVRIRGQLDDAEQLGRQAMAAFEVLEDRKGQADALTGLSAVLMGLIAMTEGAGKRGAGGLVGGLLVAALGCWMLGVFS